MFKLTNFMQDIPTAFVVLCSALTYLSIVAV